jgi:peptide deformylase
VRWITAGAGWPAVGAVPAHSSQSRGRSRQITPGFEPDLPFLQRKLSVMAIRTILEFPDQRLRTRARPVTQFDAELGRLVDDMFETMYAAPGIGLAATQVDVHKRLLVIDVSEARNEPLVFINPEILSREGVAETEEGCLSVPGIFDEVKRAAKVRVRSQDRTGATFERDFEGVLAVCVQHEMDHLEGKLFVDYLSDLKRQRIRKKLEKERKQRGTNARDTVTRSGHTY